MPKGIYKRKSVKQMFEERTDKENGPIVRKELGRCWMWKGGKCYGYGQFHVIGQHRAHRVSWILHCGEIPNDLLVLHKCDNRACVNPKHLWLGTHQDNQTDKVEKGRQAKGDRSGSRLHPERRSRGQKHSEAVKRNTPRGERHHGAKLTNKDVIEIRHIYKIGVVTIMELAIRYRLHPDSIKNVVYRRTWKHILP
jgi:hypothetical protein